MLIRLRNRRTGAVVRVDEATASRLGDQEWERPADGDVSVPVSVVEPESVVEQSEDLSPGAPAGNASRGEWAAYAESLGHSVEGLKRDEIRDLVAAGK